jgi:hypothetical protein
MILFAPALGKPVIFSARSYGATYSLDEFARSKFQAELSLETAKPID